jgi:hypothetical protein
LVGLRVAVEVDRVMKPHSLEVETALKISRRLSPALAGWIVGGVASGRFQGGFDRRCR